MRLQRLLDLRAGEGALVARITAVLVGLIGAHTMLETARDALFLGKLAPSRLSLVYAALAGLSLVAARVNQRFVTAFGRRNGLVFTLAAAAFGTELLALISESNATIFALYLWSALLGTILVVQFWMMAGHLFTVAQSKRLFGLITAGGVLGAVGGASISIAVVAYLPVRTLLPVAAALFLATAMILTTLPSDEPEPMAPDRPQSSVREVMDHAYLRRLAALIALASATVLVADYLFKSAAAMSMAKSELPRFFAGYYSILNSVALVVQVFLAGAVVRRLGVVAAFGVLPLLLLATGSAMILLGGAVVFALLVKGADGSLRHSLHRISTELLWLPLPDDVRVRSKQLVDTVATRGAQAITAGALFGLAALGWDNLMVLAGIVVSLSVLWLVGTMRLRKPYRDLFRNALHRDTPELASGRLRLDLESVEVVVEALSSREPARAIAAMDVLDSNQRARLIPALILYHESEEVLLRALDIVCTPDRRDWVPLAERLLDHKQSKIRIAALRALAKTGDAKVVEARMLDISPAVRAHAAFWLAERQGDEPLAHPAVAQIISMELKGPASGGAVLGMVGLLDAIAAAPNLRWSEIVMRLYAMDHPALMQAALGAMSRVRDPRFIPLLIERLRFREGRALVRDALVALGEPAQVALERIYAEPQTRGRLRRHLPRSLSRFGNQRAVDFLLNAYDQESDGLVRYKILRGLGRLAAGGLNFEKRRLTPHLERNLLEYFRLFTAWAALDANRDDLPSSAHRSAELLSGLLQDKLHQAQERAFRLLQMLNPEEDLRSVGTALSSNDRRLRAQGLEYLDALTLDEANLIRELVRLMADELPHAERARRARAFISEAPTSYEEAVSSLLIDADQAVAAIAAHHALEYQASGRRLELDKKRISGRIPASLEAIVRMLERAQEVPSVA